MLYKDFFGYGVKTRLKGGRENFATIVRTISRALPLQSSNFFKGTILPEKETVITVSVIFFIRTEPRNRILQAKHLSHRLEYST